MNAYGNNPRGSNRARSNSAGTQANPAGRAQSNAATTRTSAAANAAQVSFALSDDVAINDAPFGTHGTFICNTIVEVMSTHAHPTPSQDEDFSVYMTMCDQLFVDGDDEYNLLVDNGLSPLSTLV